MVFAGSILFDSSNGHFLKIIVTDSVIVIYSAGFIATPTGHKSTMVRGLVMMLTNF